MRRALTFLLGLSISLSTGVASAATVGGTTHDDDGTALGTMKYRSGHGIANRVTVEPVEEYYRLKVTERAEPLHAEGECEQAGPHSAICPWTESSNAIELDVASQADRVRIKGKVAALVHGGIGNDRLKGNGDELYGDGGRDRLIGGPGSFDRLHGGPGRDRLEGRGGGDQYTGDTFFDDETDAQAKRDVFLGGHGARAEISYATRTLPLRLDARGTRMGPEGDVVHDVKSIRGGTGDDVLVGSGGPNTLSGGPGADRLYGRGSDDTLRGGEGNDLMDGGEGDDWLTESIYFSDPGESGQDRFVGREGADQIQSLDGESAEAGEADVVTCDADDAPVESDAADRLDGACTSITGWDIAGLKMDVRPTVTEAGATFTLSCGATEIEQIHEPGGDHYEPRCRGNIALRGAAGEDYGSANFVFDTKPFQSDKHETVTVPLTAAGREAIERGALVTVEASAQSLDGWHFPRAGYRAVLGG